MTTATIEPPVLDRPAGTGEDSAKRRQIVEGARQMFLAHGFDAASMADIAKAAGVSKGTLYVYFKDKEELFGATARLDYKRGYPVTFNHDTQTDTAIRVAQDVAGVERVETETPPLMGAEDFSYMLNARPGCYIFVGNGDTAMCHHPAYDFNDDAIPAGTSFWARLVETSMPA